MTVYMGSVILFPSTPIIGSQYVLDQVLPSGGQRVITVLGFTNHKRWSENARREVHDPLITVRNEDGSVDQMPFELIRKGNNDQ